MRIDELVNELSDAGCFIDDIADPDDEETGPDAIRAINAIDEAMQFIRDIERGLGIKDTKEAIK